MPHLTPLNFLASGESGRIEQLCGTPAETVRLQELGLRPGVVVQIVQAGSPCLIRVGDSTLCFRDSEGFQILVSLTAEAVA